MKALPMPTAEAEQRKRDLGMSWLAIAALCGVSSRTLRRQLRRGYITGPKAELLRAQVPSEKVRVQLQRSKPKTIEEIANAYGGLPINEEKAS